MLNRLKKLFFDEEIEEFELDDEINEEELVKETIVQPKQKPIYEDVKEPVLVKQESKPKITIDIKADGIETKKKEEEKKATKSRLIPKREEYEMPPVISPYFGVKEEKQNTDQEKNENIEKSIKKTTISKKKEPFNTVISPFYGEQERNEYKPTISSTNVSENVYEVKKDFVDTNFMDIKESIIDNEEMDNVSLDEIISNSNSESDDLIQFSLFGDGKRISEEDFQNEEIIDDDNLPF